MTTTIGFVRKRATSFRCSTIGAGPLVARSEQAMHLRRLAGAASVAVQSAWVIGPFDDGSRGPATVHPPEHFPIDLSVPLPSGGQQLGWTARTADDGTFSRPAAESAGGASGYFYFRLQTLDRQRVALHVDSQQPTRISRNGQVLDGPSPLLLVLEPGSNDILVRVAHAASGGTLRCYVQASSPVEATLPEKLDNRELAERLKNAGDATTSVSAEFASVDWASAVRGGNVERGRRLFGAGTLGCANCHAVTASQKGGGASLPPARPAGSP